VESNVIDAISFEPDVETLSTRFRVDRNSSDFQTIARLCQEAQEIARPRFIYKVAFIEERGKDFVVLDGVRFKSRVMSVNLSKLNRVFPIIATSGREIEEWSKGIHDMLQRYWADQIKEMALRSALKEGMKAIDQRYHLGKTAYMSPGSIEDWPLDEQAGLFALLGNAVSAIGVELTDSFLMLPPKTVSRIMFATEADYQNCRLCPRKNCPNRRAPHVPDLYEKTYGLQKQVNWKPSDE
jgi:hypothetical protein